RSGEGRPDRGTADSLRWAPSFLFGVRLPPPRGQQADSQRSEALEEEAAGPGTKGVGLGMRQPGSERRRLPADPSRAAPRLRTPPGCLKRDSLRWARGPRMVFRRTGAPDPRPV